MKEIKVDKEKKQLKRQDEEYDQKEIQELAFLSVKKKTQKTIYDKK